MKKVSLIILLFFIFYGQISFASIIDVTNLPYTLANKLLISLGIFFSFSVLIYFILKTQSNYNKELIKQFQVFDTNKMEELRLYMLIIGILAPLSEFFIQLFHVRQNDEFDYNLIVGFILILLYFISKKNPKLIKISYLLFLLYFFFFFGFTSYKLFIYNTEIILFAEFFLLIFFSYYIFYKLIHYYLFILLVFVSNILLILSPSLTIEHKVILVIFSYIILVLNHLRQIIYYKQQEHLFFINNVINSGISLVIASNKEGKISYVSENVKNILGYSSKELLGDGWWKKTIDDKTNFDNKKNELFEEVKLQTINHRLIKTKNNEYRWYQFHDKKFNDDLYVGIGQDITELKTIAIEKQKTEQKNKQQQEILQKVNKIQYHDFKDFSEDINQIIKIVSDGISLDLISLLEYKEGELEVISNYEKNKDSFSSGETFSLNKYPIYKNALLSGQNIIVSDTLNNELTKEFVDGYIKEKNIKSLADIPIFIGGKLNFIISCEHIQDYYDWDDNDVQFIKNIAEFLTILIENRKRKEAEIKVLESENIFRQINETIDNVFFLFDIINIKVLYISPSCKDILGVDQQNFYDKYDYWDKYILPEDKEKIISCHEKLVLQGFYEVDYRINKNGEIRWIKEKSYGIQDDKGVFIKSSGICTDITEDKQKEEDLKKLSLIAERTSNGVSITDKDGRVLWVNQGYLDLFEITQEEIFGKIPRELFIKHNDGLLNKITELNGTNYKIELEVTTHLNNHIWVEVNNTIITNSEGEFLQQIDVITDITERIKTKQKLESQSIILEEYAKDLEYQNKLKEKLIHADHIKEVVHNTLLFIKEQYDNTILVSILFPDINYTRYNGYYYYKNEFKDEYYFTNELQCIEKCLNGEIFIKEDLKESNRKSASDIKYIEKGIHSYIVFPIQIQNEFLGILILAFSEKLNLNFKQITYLKETTTVVGVTLNQIRLKDILQSKNEDILSSIIYAKNIQTSLFTDLKTFSPNFQNVSLFYRPKDIVSGDFYWGKDTEEFSYLTMGDCTGHGVPGAFITLLGINFLEQLIGIEKKTDPADILTQLDNRLSSILKNHTSSEDSLYEGMELAVCVYNKKEKRLYFSGAGLGILYFHNNEEIHIRGIRGGIGEPKADSFSYNTTSIPVSGYEYFFLATDGYQDQLGGEKNKRFSKNRLISLLNDIKFKDAEVQEKILSDTMDQYVGNYWQLDDFTVIGFNIQF
ncbi:MAG: PAS domain S-box protein [Flavobacteriia bacterium]|nr:PAS domain S-box protein [Flavobacteriia bacterium]